MSEILTRQPITEAPERLARPVCLADLVTDLVADAEETLRAATEGRARGPITGLSDLDAALGGSLAPGPHVVTGDPGSGKTALALQIAATCGCPALFVTAEQSPLVLFRRHVARATSTPVADLLRAMPVKVRELATRAAQAAPMVMFLDATTGPAPSQQIEGLGAALRERFQAHHVLLVVDALQPWARGLGVGAEYDLIQGALAELVGVTARLRAPALVLSHRNRASAGNKFAAMTAAKGSADFEHMAETVLHLSREGDDAGDPYSSRLRQINVSVAKNRHGPAGFSLTLTFDEWMQQIR